MGPAVVVSRPRASVFRVAAVDRRRDREPVEVVITNNSFLIGTSARIWSQDLASPPASQRSRPASQMTGEIQTTSIGADDCQLRRASDLGWSLTHQRHRRIYANVESHGGRSQARSRAGRSSHHEQFVPDRERRRASGRRISGATAHISTITELSNHSECAAPQRDLDPRESWLPRPLRMW